MAYIELTELDLIVLQPLQNVLLVIEAVAALEGSISRSPTGIWMSM